MARDFDDVGREEGGEAIRDALNNAAPAWEGPPPLGDDAPPRPKFTAQPFAWRDPASIPRRQFLYGFELRRGQVSATVAPGAAGKTTFKIGRAILMATGHEYFGHRVWNGPHRVWLWNLEDDLEEIEKTVHAFLKLWDIEPAELGDRLFINGSDSINSGKLKLAVEDDFGGGFKIQRPVVEALTEELLERRIDYLDIDPFVSSHSVNENSNQAIDAVTKEWLAVARDADCAVNLTHHLRKSTGTEFSANDARGAGAMIAAARSVLVLQRMSKEAADEMGIADCDRKRYFSVYDDKNNKCPPAGKAEWYEFESVGLGNGDETGPEDSIGACNRYEPPEVFAGVTARLLYHVLLIVQNKPEEARYDSRAKNWVGKHVAHVCDLSPSGDKARIKKIIDTWIDNGALAKVERRDHHGEVRMFVEPRNIGHWAEYQ